MCRAHFRRRVASSFFGASRTAGGLGSGGSRRQGGRGRVWALLGLWIRRGDQASRAQRSWAESTGIGKVIYYHLYPSPLYKKRFL